MISYLKIGDNILRRIDEGNIFIAFIILSLKTASLMLLHPKEIRDHINRYKNLVKDFSKFYEYFGLYDSSCKKLSSYLYRLVSKFYESNFENLEVEYTKLFRAAYPKVLCPSYESVYRSARKRVMDPFIIGSLENIYRKAGLEIEINKVELPEHVAVELEALAYIISRALTDDISVQLMIDLYRKHLSKWLPLFSQCIKESSKEVFYKDLAEVLCLLHKCIAQALDMFF